MTIPHEGEGWSVNLGAAPPGTLHLRALRSHVAESRLLAWLDALHAHGEPGGTIVHGRSGGALRQVVREVLAADERVVEVLARDESGRASAGAVSFRFG
ncbi:Smr/MutS family protein [bacterium]|nr:Smr/MutS family protein [bacterium]